MNQLGAGFPDVKLAANWLCQLASANTSATDEATCSSEDLGSEPSQIKHEQALTVIVFSICPNA